MEKRQLISSHKFPAEREKVCRKDECRSGDDILNDVENNEDPSAVSHQRNKRPFEDFCPQLHPNTTTGPVVVENKKAPMVLRLASNLSYCPLTEGSHIQCFF